MAEEIKKPDEGTQTPPAAPDVGATARTPQDGTEDAQQAAAATVVELAKKAAADKSAADAALAQAALSSAAVTPLALSTIRHEAAGRPPIRKGERRSLQVVYGRMQNPVTLQWFEGDPVKVTVDDWTLVQYYAEEPKLQLNED